MDGASEGDRDGWNGKRRKSWLVFEAGRTRQGQAGRQGGMGRGGRVVVERKTEKGEEE